MNKERGVIKAISLIIELLQRKEEVRFQDIEKCLRGAGMEVQKRTIERYIEYLRNDFGVDIHCDRRTNLYSIDKESSPDMNRLLRFIQLFNSSEWMMNSLKNSGKALSCLAFESNVAYDWSSNLETIYSAILQSKIIAFDHENYEKNTISKRTIKPYLLKEYDHIWYVVGILADSDKVRTFGLDRINNIEISDQTFKKIEQNRIDKLFYNLIGLVYDKDKPTNIRLSFTPREAKYFKKTPLHPTQEIVSENEKEVVFKYWLIPNRELQRLILGYGAQVKVLKPEWFAKQIEEQIKEMLELYKK
ncbi:MAG: WYL domain-containing protein [Candidatus Symbiothrix sp.]|jgi:predicted DNA-binding transcriptional regulator YafY|nr:WYL domain-containing protein [Candidatus Symbiothrix sp.]